MKLASMPWVSLLVLLSCTIAVGQAPPPEPNHKPPQPREEHQNGLSRGHNDRPLIRWRKSAPPMDEKQIHEVLGVLHRIDPTKANELDKLIKEDPEQAEKILRTHFPNLGRFIAWQRHDPEGFELRVKDLELSRKTRDCAIRLREAITAEDDELAALEQIQLQGLVAEHFDARQKVREYELLKLRDRIEALQAQLEERANNRAELIEERMEEMIDEEWERRW